MVASETTDGDQPGGSRKTLSFGWKRSNLGIARVDMSVFNACIEAFHNCCHCPNLRYPNSDGSKIWQSPFVVQYSMRSCHMVSCMDTDKEVAEEARTLTGANHSWFCFLGTQFVEEQELNFGMDLVALLGRN